MAGSAKTVGPTTKRGGSRGAVTNDVHKPKSTEEARRRAFGAALAEAMTSRGMSQMELARQLDMTQSAISSWRCGDSVPIHHETTFQVEKALKVNPGHLSRHLGYYPPEAVN